MLRPIERAILDDVILAEQADPPEWAAPDIERGREVLSEIDANFTAGPPAREATADFIACLLHMIDQMGARLMRIEETAWPATPPAPAVGTPESGIDAPSAAYRSPEDWATRASLGRDQRPTGG